MIRIKYGLSSIEYLGYVVKDAKCAHCGEMIAAPIIVNAQYISAFSFSAENKINFAYCVCPKCKTLFEFTQKDYKKIISAKPHDLEFLYRCSDYMKKQQYRKCGITYCTNFYDNNKLFDMNKSKRKAWITAILNIFLGGVEAHRIYMGKYYSIIYDLLPISTIIVWGIKMLFNFAQLGELFSTLYIFTIFWIFFHSINRLFDLALLSKGLFLDTYGNPILTDKRYNMIKEVMKIVDNNNDNTKNTHYDMLKSSNDELSNNHQVNSESFFANGGDL